MNGVQQGATQNVALAAFSGQLQVGAWITGAANADFLGGTIDEVRVYNRTLAPAEIQTDMATPISPPAPDSVAPTVALTAPAAGATVSGSVNVTANASDNVGVVGVQFLLDGANVGVEDTTAPYSVVWNTTAATNGTHTLTARARDGAGNTTTSAARTVTVTNAAATGPVAAYAFDEGSGTSVADASAAANNGTVSGAVWASGRYGGGLRFDGTDDVVTVVDAASLDLTTAMTLEAWVNPAAVPTNWRSIVVKERATNSMTYQLAANSNTNVPATRGYIANGVRTLQGGTRLTAGTWGHPGRHLRRGHAAPLRQRCPGGQPCPDGHHHGHGERAAHRGQHHDGPVLLRHHRRGPGLRPGPAARPRSRPTSPTPVTDPPADTTPPVLSNGLPTGPLAAGTTQTTLQVTTNENATCRYATTAGHGLRVDDQHLHHHRRHGPLHHGHRPDQRQRYTFYVRCQDTASNATTTDFAHQLLGRRTRRRPADGGSTAPANGATVSGTVNVNANASDNIGVIGVQFLLDGANFGVEDTTAPYTLAWNTTAATNGTHSLTARARDAAANTTTSASRTVTVANAAATGPVAAYAFNEGAGTTVTDASPSAVNATATSPNWTTGGRYGAAITFNGTTTRVTRNSPLTLTGAFTIEAWVLNPTNTAFETIASVGATRDLFLANGTLGFWNGTSDTIFGAAVPLNTWTHVAFVSTGTTIAVYLNGTQQGTTQNLTLANVTATLQIGAWANGATNTDYLGGTIDEVRVYNRALAAAEIQTDMATPVSPP